MFTADAGMGESALAFAAVLRRLESESVVHEHRASRSDARRRSSRSLANAPLGERTCPPKKFGIKSNQHPVLPGFLR